MIHVFKHFGESLVYIVGDEFETSCFHSNCDITDTIDDIPESTKYYFDLMLAISYLTFIPGNVFVSAAFANEWSRTVISLGFLFQSICAFLSGTVKLDSQHSSLRRRSSANFITTFKDVLKSPFLICTVIFFTTMFSSIFCKTSIYKIKILSVAIQLSLSLNTIHMLSYDVSSWITYIFTIQCKIYQIFKCFILTSKKTSETHTNQTCRKYEKFRLIKNEKQTKEVVYHCKAHLIVIISYFHQWLYMCFESIT